MPLLGQLGYSGSYVLPVAVARVGGPRFAEGAPNPEDCREDTVYVAPEGGKHWLFPPRDRLPADVVEVLSFKDDRFRVRRCPRSQCLEAIYDRVNKSWYCSKFGGPCPPGGCQPVPDDALYTWTESFVEGQKKVRATPDGTPIFDAAAAPVDPGSALSSGQLPPAVGWGALALAAGLGIMLLLRR
jgi:hypothetical protein